MKLSLVVLNAGKASGQTIPIAKVPFVIGRDPECQLRPASALISKRHCAIAIKGGQILVQDFGSTNGTFVNDKQVSAESPLAKDDILKVGPLTFKVLIEHTVLKTAPAPAKPPQSSSVSAMSPTPAQGMPKLNASSLSGKAPAKTPPPPAKPAAARGNADDAAAMLLSVDDDGGEDTASDVNGGLSIADIPGGNTEILPALKSTEETATDKPTPAPAPKVEEKKKITIGSAQDAAKAILDKLTRRK